jgi:hypothetical protein
MSNFEYLIEFLVRAYRRFRGLDFKADVAELLDAYHREGRGGEGCVLVADIRRLLGEPQTFHTPELEEKQ